MDVNEDCDAGMKRSSAHMVFHAIFFERHQLEWGGWLIYFLLEIPQYRCSLIRNTIAVTLFAAWGSGQCGRPHREISCRACIDAAQRTATARPAEAFWHLRF